MKTDFKIPGYGILGYSQQDKEESQKREESMYDFIIRIKKEQGAVLKMKEVDWNNPQLRTPFI